MAGPSILVVEDEIPIADAVAARLRSEGYTVETVADGLAAVDAAARMRPDAVVLDLMLPGVDGLEVCRRLQQTEPVPILMLTARDSVTDKVIGLGVGADDYMTKPFSSRELVARVAALIRRSERTRTGSQTYRSAGIEVEVAKRRVTVSGAEVHLTPTEFDLVAHMAANPGVVFSRDRLLSEVWGYRDGSGARTVDSHVRSIRGKLGRDSIRTVHGVGYAFAEPA